MKVCLLICLSALVVAACSSEVSGPMQPEVSSKIRNESTTLGVVRKYASSVLFPPYVRFIPAFSASGHSAAGYHGTTVDGNYSVTCFPSSATCFSTSLDGSYVDITEGFASGGTPTYNNIGE